MRPLNPVLFNRLKKVFGEVKIANEGEHFRGKVVHDPINTDRRKLAQGGTKGEEYRVCCPRCKDGRFRLWFNHRYGTMFEGLNLRRMFTCHRRHCEEERDFADWVTTQLKGYVARDLASRKMPGSEEESDTAAMTSIVLPESTPLHLLPQDHPAVMYLSGRGYDVAALGQNFDVRWCEHNPYSPRHNRILFPIYAVNEYNLIKCFGFQARFFDPVNWNDKPDKGKGEVKWHTYSAKVKRLLYNSISTRNSPVIMVTEGPLDVPSAGAQFGLATFGKTMSPIQREMLWRGWGQHGAVLVLAYDPDAWDTVQRVNQRGAEKLMALEKELQQTWKCVVRLNFAEGWDPGKTGYKALWEAVLNELKRRNDMENFNKVASTVGVLVP